MQTWTRPSTTGPLHEPPNTHKSLTLTEGGARCVFGRACRRSGITFSNQGRQNIHFTRHKVCFQNAFKIRMTWRFMTGIWRRPWGSKQDFRCGRFRFFASKSSSFLLLKTPLWLCAHFRLTVTKVLSVLTHWMEPGLQSKPAWKQELNTWTTTAAVKVCHLFCAGRS